jgi:hypothetical protein
VPLPGGARRRIAAVTIEGPGRAAYDGPAPAPARIEVGDAMTLCPVALAVGCKRCALFKICPAKGIIGDYKKDAGTPPPSDQPKQ